MSLPPLDFWQPSYIVWNVIWRVSLVEQFKKSAFSSVFATLKRNRNSSWHQRLEQVQTKIKGSIFPSYKGVKMKMDTIATKKSYFLLKKINN